MLLKLLKICRFITGLVFLTSGLLKAMDAAAFADLMSRYGAAWLGLAAPLVILFEIGVGVMLVFDFYPNHTAGIAAAFLLIVSGVFAYGVICRGITDCGCFGPITWLNTQPWLTFTRNGILLGMLLPTGFAGKENTAPPALASGIFMAVIAVIVMFMCGFSMHGAQCLQKHTSFQPMALDESPLSGYVSCNPDSAYLIFAFSYSCPYCLNSIGNVNQYVPMGMVDRVIGFAVENDVARERFYRLFDIGFDIREIPETQMYRLSRTLPATFLVRHDSIVNQHIGMTVSPALLLP